MCGKALVMRDNLLSLRKLAMAPMEMESSQIIVERMERQRKCYEANELKRQTHWFQ